MTGVWEEKPTPYDWRMKKSKSRNFDWNGWLEVTSSHVQRGQRRRTWKLPEFIQKYDKTQTQLTF